MSGITGRVKGADRGEFKKAGQFHEIFRRLRKDRGAMVGLIILIVLILTIIFADVIIPYPRTGYFHAEQEDLRDQRRGRQPDQPQAGLPIRAPL